MITIAAIVLALVFWPVTLLVLAVMYWPVTLCLLIVFGAIYVFCHACIALGKVFN